jgi:serine/threonine protein phosphatase PrpC
MHVTGRTDVGRRRGNNEDAWDVSDLVHTENPPDGALCTFDVSESGVLLAVSDGMGGARAGEVASGLVLDSVERELGHTAGVEARLAALRKAVERANLAVFEAAKSAERRGMGATLTALFIDGAVAHIAEVGDSRAYLIRTGRIRQITKDQSYVQVLIDSGVLTPEEAKHSPMRNVILQAMGQKATVDVALGRLELRRGDLLLLCSDGLHGKLADDELLALALQPASLAERTQRMINLANERGGEDNITVILAELDGEGLPLPGRRESVTQTLTAVKL